MKRTLIRLVTLPCALLVSGVALAHTGHHEVPGFFSGLSHPLTGSDHLAAMLAVGLWAGIGVRGQAWLPVTTFLLFMACGAALGMNGIALPGGDAGPVAGNRRHRAGGCLRTVPRQCARRRDAVRCGTRALRARLPRIHGGLAPRRTRAGAHRAADPDGVAVAGRRHDYRWFWRLAVAGDLIGRTDTEDAP